MASRALMFQGTGSDVGKSLIVAGLCRALTLRGMRVRPFKPQNMSNNAAVAADGGEIGRAQALQARACRVEPSVHMNPVLLKPQSDIGAQVVLRGRALGSARAKEYQTWKPALRASVLESYQRLRNEADIVVVEGAGSAAEINLRADDIANMGLRPGDPDTRHPDRRYRPRRSHCSNRRNARRARSRRRANDRRLRREQVSRRSVSVRGRHAINRRKERLEEFRSRALFP
jgi:hypothetical protein